MQVEAHSDSSPEAMRHIKQGTLAGSRTDTGLAFTVTGVPFKASASPERALSKLTALVGFSLCRVDGPMLRSQIQRYYYYSGFTNAMNGEIGFFSVALQQGAIGLFSLDHSAVFLVMLKLLNACDFFFQVH